MPWNDDSWKDSYDAWKTREPDYGDEPDECDHDDYDTDLIEGRATCNKCGLRWGMSAADIQAEIDRQQLYYEQCAEQERPWNRLKLWWRDTWLVTWARTRWWAWRHPHTEAEDEPELPF